MAKLVTIIGITHNPFMPGSFSKPSNHPEPQKSKSGSR